MSKPRPARPARLRSVTGLGFTFALAVATLAGCAAAQDDAAASAGSNAGSRSSSSTATTAETTATVPASVEEVRAANSDQTVVNDDEWSQDEAVDVVLSGSGATSDSSGVTAADGLVTITEGGVYRLTGDLAGTVSIDAPEDATVVLILDGAAITAEDAAAIQAVTADDVALFLAEGSENSVSSTGAYDGDANAAIWADNDLTVSGAGSLAVDGAAEDAITSKDDLVILSGTLALTAADDGLTGNDSLTVRGGTITVDAGGDGLSADQDEDATQGWIDISGGTLDITALSDGLDGYTDVVITDGTLIISAEEGIEAGTIVIGGGTIDITATDDGINGSAGSSDGATGGGMGGGGMQDSGELVLIAGGEVTLDAQGDGLDSNGSMEISGGTTVVYGPTNSGNGALDTNGEFTVSGGTLIALGSAGMAESPSTSSAQAWVAALASGSAGSTVEIRDADGTVLATTTAPKQFETVVVSSADIVADGTYTFAVDDSDAVSATAGEALAGGMSGGGGMPGGGGPRG